MICAVRNGMGGAHRAIAVVHALGKPGSIPIFQTIFTHLKLHFGVSTFV